MNNKNLRVVQLIVGEPWGGAERFFVKLSIALQKRGLKQIIAIQRDQKRAEELRDGGCQVLELDFGKGLSDWKSRRVLQHEVSIFDPHIVVAWMSRAARRMPKGKFIKVGRLGGYYPIKSYKKCDWLIANTPDLERFIIGEGWPRDRVRMITNFGELPEACSISRDLVNTPKSAFVVLAMGRLHPSKGFDTLLEAISRTKGTYLWLAGTGELEDSLKHQAEKLLIVDRVRFLGWRDDQSSLLEACDVCVVPSRHEPLGNVILEAWSRSVPVIAAASEGPSWLIEDRTSGILFPIDNSAALASGIELLRNNDDLRREIAVEGNLLWQHNYSADIICQNYIDFYSSISKSL